MAQEQAFTPGQAQKLRRALAENMPPADQEQAMREALDALEEEIAEQRESLPAE